MNTNTYKSFFLTALYGLYKDTLSIILAHNVRIKYDLVNP